MLLHPSYFLFFIFLIFSTLMVLSPSSWFVAWMALEVNMLSFIPMILKKKNKYTAESALKYFLVQALASLMVIVPMISSISTNHTYLTMIVISALALKVGMAPFHQWVPSFIEGLTWNTSSIFFIIQKINPLLLLSICPMIMTLNLHLVLSVILISTLIGSVGGLNQTSLRKIMVYSSIAHLAWMLSAIYMSSSLWMMYYFFYALILFTTLNILKNMEVYNLNHLLLKQKTYSLMFAMCFFSLGGLPPFSGFIPKLMVSLKLIEETNAFLFLFLLSSTFLSLFFYMRIILSNNLMSHSYKLSHYFNMHNNSTKNLLNTLGMMTPMFFFMV